MNPPSPPPVASPALTTTANESFNHELAIDEPASAPSTPLPSGPLLPTQPLSLLQPVGQSIQSICQSIIRKRLKSDVKDFQWQSVEAILVGNDVSLVQGTGSGKTWTFYLIQMVHAAIQPQSCRKSVLVVSPYVALMKFQSESFSKQIPDARIAVLGSIDSDGDAIKKILASDAEFIWTTPEFLSSLWAQPMRYGHLLSSLLKQTVAWVFDEVHMVFDVGETYRNCYLSLDSLRRKYESIPVLICSATIPRDRYDELKGFLRMGLGKREDGDNRSLLELIGDVDRSNVYYTVSLKQSDDVDFNYIFEAVKSGEFPAAKFPVVIYWNDKAKLHQLYHKVSALMQGMSQKIFIYTADVSDNQKDGIISAIQKHTATIILATGALGLGVDIRNARKVHHAAIPVSFCDMVQELGRAGRDGLHASHILRITSQDLPELKDCRKRTLVAQDAEKGRYEGVYSAYISGKMCRRQVILDFFVNASSNTSKPAICCDVCTNKSMDNEGMELKVEKVAKQMKSRPPRMKPLSATNQVLMLNELVALRRTLIKGNSWIEGTQFSMKLAESIADNAYNVCNAPEILCLDGISTEWLSACVETARKYVQIDSVTKKLKKQKQKTEVVTSTLSKEFVDSDEE